MATVEQTMGATTAAAGGAAAGAAVAAEPRAAKRKGAGRAGKKARRLPSKQTLAKVAVCVLVFAVFAALPVFANTLIGYVPVMAYVLVLVLCFVYVKLLERGLVVQTGSVGEGCARGDAVNFSLTVTNKSFLPAVSVQALLYLSDLFGGEGATSAHNLTLPPRSSKTFDFGVRFDHIGTYKVGITQVKVSDVLGLFSAVKHNDRLAHVDVQPRIFDVGKLELSKDAAVEAKKNFSAVINEGMDYAGVREYRWGDPIKAIHWKLSANMPNGEYLTRLYETNANPGMAIVADFAAPQCSTQDLMGLYDAVVETVFSLIRFAEANNIEAELAFVGRCHELQRLRTPLNGRWQDLLSRMPRVDAGGDAREALRVVEEESGTVFAASNLIVVSASIGKELADSLIASRTGKCAPLLFALLPQSCDADEAETALKPLKALSTAGIPCVALRCADELEEAK